VLIFPKILFSAFYRAKLVGLNIETFSEFMARYLKGVLFSSLEMLPIAMIMYIIFIKRKRWYIYVSICVVLIGIGGAYISPYIDEMQNDLVAMDEGEIKNSIVKLAKDTGIEDLDIRVIEKSNSTNSINAYMTGAFGSRRIVFWDTTLKLSNEEILAIAAHEMGHYKMNHIQKGMIVTFIITILLILVTHIIMVKYKGRDYRVIDNIPKILFILNILFLAMSPIETAYSRNMEYDADEFAMEATNDGYTNGVLEIKFIQQNLSPIDVNSLYKWLVYDHPTVKDRIEHSNEFIKSTE
jgi:STE24 endopeptidase